MSRQYADGEDAEIDDRGRRADRLLAVTPAIGKRKSILCGLFMPTYSMTKRRARMRTVLMTVWKLMERIVEQEIRAWRAFSRHELRTIRASTGRGSRQSRRSPSAFYPVRSIAAADSTARFAPLLPTRSARHALVRQLVEGHAEV